MSGPAVLIRLTRTFVFSVLSRVPALLSSATKPLVVSGERSSATDLRRASRSILESVARRGPTCLRRSSRSGPAALRMETRRLVLSLFSRVEALPRRPMRMSMIFL